MTPRRGPALAALAAAALSCAGPARALSIEPPELELDPYYTALSVTVPFSSATMAAQVDRGEWQTYLDATWRALIPRFLLLEASVNPLPLAGAAIRSSSEGFYHRARVTPSFNLIESVTSGFEEPYAFAVFLGGITDYSAGRKSRGHRRKGYVGYLASYGNYHLMEGLFVPDNWLETEAKIKGDLVTDARKMSWSFRFGAKTHHNAEVTDTAYLGLRRDRIDYQKVPLSFLLSTGIDYRIDFRQGDLKPISQFVLVEKNFPYTTRNKKTYTFSLGVGYQWQSPDKYRGGLALKRTRPESQILFRPNLKF